MDIGKSHIELLHLNECENECLDECYFDPVVSSSISLCEASEKTIPRREYQNGEIKD